MRNGPIPLAVHALLEPFVAVLLIVSPFLLGFSDVDEATAVAIVAGVVVLLVGMTTNWRLAVVRVIPLPLHAMLDLGLGVALIASPFLFGFSDESAPTIFFVAVGLGEIVASLGTRWTHAADLGTTDPDRDRRLGRRAEPRTSPAPRDRDRAGRR